MASTFPELALHAQFDLGSEGFAGADERRMQQVGQVADLNAVAAKEKRLLQNRLAARKHRGKRALLKKHLDLMESEASHLREINRALRRRLTDHTRT